MRNLDKKIHENLEETCKMYCTRKLGWTKEGRKDCRENTMCFKCQDLIERVDMSSRNIEVRVDKIKQAIIELDADLKKAGMYAWISDIPSGDLNVKDGQQSFRIGQKDSLDIH